MHTAPLVVNAGVALSPRRLRMGSLLLASLRCFPLPRAAVPSRAGWGRGVVDAGGGRGRGRVAVVWWWWSMLRWCGSSRWWWSTWWGVDMVVVDFVWSAWGGWGVVTVVSSTW